MISEITVFGLKLSLYTAFYIGGFIGCFILNTLLAPKYNEKKWKIFLYTITVYSVANLWDLFLCYLETHSWGGTNMVRIFIWIPIIAFPISRIFKIDWGKACDIAGPSMLLTFGISHYGCIFAGCCHGYPMEHGIYSALVEHKCFPIQPIEATSAIILCFVIIKYLHNHNFKTNGLAYSLTLMLFGYTRVIWEIFRDNNLEYPGIPSLGISSLQIHAAICACIGTIWWIVYKKKFSNKVIK